MARASWLPLLLLCCSSVVSALGSLATEEVSASPPPLTAWSAGRVWNTVKRSAARLKTIQKRRGPGRAGRALRREGDVPQPLPASLLPAQNSRNSTARSSDGPALVYPPVAAGLLLQGLPVLVAQQQSHAEERATGSGDSSRTTAARRLQQQEGVVAWLERDREEDERAAARLVALQQRLNLTEGERAAVRATVRDAAIDMLHQQVMAPDNNSQQLWPAALPGSNSGRRAGPQQEEEEAAAPPSALQLPSRAAALGGLLSPLRAKDGTTDNTTTTTEASIGNNNNNNNTVTTASPPVDGPSLTGDKQEAGQGPLGALVGPAQRLQLTEQDQERIRQALRDAAMVVVQRAAQQQRQQLQLQGGLAGGALQSLAKSRQGAPVLRLRGEESSTSVEGKEEVGQPDGGVLVNPGPTPPTRSRGLQSSSSASGSGEPLLTVSLRPGLGGDEGDGSRLRGRPLNLTDAERTELRQAVGDMATKVLHEMDAQQAADRDEQPLLVVRASQREAPEVAALLSAARAVAAAASVSSAAKHHASASQQQQPDDLVFHHHQRRLPEDATTTATTATTTAQKQQVPASPGQQQQQDLAARLRTSLSDRYNSLSDAEKAELQAAVRSAALALLREAAARDFGL